MLPAAHRMTDGVDFRETTRRGARAPGRRVVLHLLPGTSSVSSSGAAPASPARIGFVVSRSVGGSVVRNRVQRRLRHLLRSRVGLLPGGSRLVVRALPPAASASSAELEDDLARAFRRLDLGAVR